MLGAKDNKIQINTTQSITIRILYGSNGKECYATGNIALEMCKEYLILLTSKEDNIYR